MSKISAYTARTTLAPSDIVPVETSSGSNTGKATIPQLHGTIDIGGTPVPHTGDTSEFTVKTIAIPGNALGANGQIEICALFGKSGTAGSATYRIKFGGTTFHANSPSATTLSYEVRLRIANQNATNAQVGVASSVGSGLGSSTSANVTAAIDTTASQNVVITVQGGNSADTESLQSWHVIVHPSP